MELRAWVEVELAAVRDNARLVRRRTGSRVMAVLKADAYGLGALAMARALEGAVDFFAVANPGEAFELRDAGIAAPLFVLGAVFPDEIPGLAGRGISFAVHDAGTRDQLLKRSPSLKSSARVHLKVDTGMSRLGFAPARLAETAALLRDAPGVRLEGVFSHLAAPPREHPDFCRLQVRRFRRCLGLMRRAGTPPLLAHLAATSGITQAPGTAFDMVRPGLILYGYDCSGRPAEGGYRPALTLKSRVVAVREVPRGATVGYGRSFTAERKTRLAILPIGYADGYRRHLSNRGSVLWRGTSLPVAGTVCMDMTIVDATGRQVRPGDEVVLMGRQGDASLEPADLAAAAGTNAYEIITGLAGRRVKKVYLADGASSRPGAG